MVLTARAAMIASSVNEISAWVIMSSLACGESTGVSVGLNAVLVWTMCDATLSSIVVFSAFV